jgi:hypothetical protein
MPAKSQSQQRLFGMVHAYQKGHLRGVPGFIKRIANHISYKDAKDFASTKHKGLPKYASLREILNGAAVASYATPIIYQSYKEVKIHEEIQRLFRNLKVIEYTPEVQEAIDSGDLLVIDDMQKFRAWLKNDFLLDKNLMDNSRHILEGMMKEGNNACFIGKGEVTKKHVVIIPSRLKHTVVAAHEVGHYLDMRKHKIDSGDTFHKRIYRPGYSLFKSIYSNPKATPMYTAEQRAWNNAGVPENDPMRMVALESYENVLRFPRRLLMGATAAMGFHTASRYV